MREQVESILGAALPDQLWGRAAGKFEDLRQRFPGDHYDARYLAQLAADICFEDAFSGYLRALALVRNREGAQ